MRKANNQEPSKEDAAILDVWLTAKEVAMRLKKSPSTIYSLVRRGSGIPYAQLPGTKIILFNWKSVDAWLHSLETENRRKNFQD